ncbi:MAG: hypothetical protein ACK55Z_30245, partial [bacterium]
QNTEKISIHNLVNVYQGEAEKNLHSMSTHQNKQNVVGVISIDCLHALLHMHRKIAPNMYMSEFGTYSLVAYVLVAKETH